MLLGFGWEVILSDVSVELGARLLTSYGHGPSEGSWVLRAEQNLDPDLKYQGRSSSLALICY